MLWWLTDDPTLADDIKDRLDQEADVYVSSATVWEVAIKQALGKLEPADLPERIRSSGFRLLVLQQEIFLTCGDVWFCPWTASSHRRA